MSALIHRLNSRPSKTISKIFTALASLTTKPTGPKNMPSKSLTVHTKKLTASNGFRSGQNRYPTENRPTFVCSPVGSVLEHGQAGSSRSYFSQVSEKSRSDTRVTQDRPGFYY